MQATRKAPTNAFYRLMACGVALASWFTLTAPPVQAYVFTTNSGGTFLRWSTPMKPTFTANWSNGNLLSYSNVFSAITDSLQRWKYTGTTTIDFDYIQSGTNPATWGFDGKNAVFFASQSSQKLGASTLGVTYVFSNVATGAIAEADIEFNDESFIFTNNKIDSTQFGTGSRVFLGNVATHEFGHAFGLAHSAALQSAMVFIEDRGQAFPSCDDIIGMGTAYPAAGFTAPRGSMSGNVVDGTATNVFGAHVLAISKTRGTVVASAITNPDGTWLISNLDPGDYYVMVEPFQITTSAANSSLCGGTAAGCFFGTINSGTRCGGGTSPFKRMFIETVAGTPTRFTVNAGVDTAVGTTTTSCAAMTEPFGGAADVVATAPTIISNALDIDAVGVARGVAQGVGTSQYFKLFNVHGTISAKVLSYGLYGPMDMQVSFTTTAGVAVGAPASTTTNDNGFQDSSNFVNYDPTAVMSGAVAGDYLVKVTNNGNLSSSPNLYPAGTVGASGANPQIDQVNYYVLIVTINDSTTVLSPLTNNMRCEAGDNFPAFPDHGPGTSTTSTSGGGGGGSGGGGGCGTINNHGGPPDAQALFSAWGIMVMLGLGRLLQRLARRAVAR